MSQEVRNLLSICKVLPDANLGYSRMRRIADIVDEKVIFPQYNLNEPRTFANREYLFLRDPEYFEDGFIGVWEWTATENLNDPTKDYTETIYRDDIHPIEVIIYDDLSSISQLVKMIKDGINFYIEPDKVMLAVKTGKYLQGFHINSKNFIKKNDKYFINEDVIKLPRYKFNYDQIVEIEKGKYLRTLDLTSHIDGYSQVKKPEEVVKEIILHNISWQNLKLEGYHREAYQKIKNYISGIKTESVTNEVKNVLSCTENEAKHYVSEFMSNVKTHLNGKTVEDKTLISLIERNEDLLKRCNKQIENEWIKENQDKIKEKEYELTNLLEMIDSSNKEIEEKNKKMKQLEEKVNLLKKDHEALEKLGSDFKMKIQEKITSAKEDVASFMSDMTFLTASIPTAPIIKKDEYVEKEIKEVHIVQAL